MGRFSNRTPEEQGQRQASSVMKSLQGKEIQSVGTARNYEQALKSVATALAEEGKNLKDLTPETAQNYLETRAEEVSQKTLDMERQAIQAMMKHVTHALSEKETLAVVKSEKETILKSRAYTPEQIKEIASHQSEKHALATLIAHSAGLRAHELATLQPISEKAPDERPALNEKFSGREGASYTVTGKGGLVREVVISKELAEKLEARRLETPEKTQDRGVNYTTHYDIGHGKNWSNSFSSASNRALGFSHGAHGVRHSYAQERMTELRSVDRKEGFLSYEKALEVVSQEMGHFRPEITQVYLR